MVCDEIREMSLTEYIRSVKGIAPSMVRIRVKCAFFRFGGTKLLNGLKCLDRYLFGPKSVRPRCGDDSR